MIKKETIEEFVQIIKEDYQKDISFEEASSILRDTVKYFDLLACIDYRDFGIYRNLQTRYYPATNTYITFAILIPDL